MDEIKRVISALNDAGYKTRNITIPSKWFYSAETDSAKQKLIVSFSYDPDHLDCEKDITQATINLSDISIGISLYPVKKATINIRIKTYEDGKLLDSQPRADIDKSINTVSELIKELGYVVI